MNESFIDLAQETQDNLDAIDTYNENIIPYQLESLDIMLSGLGIPNHMKK